METQSIKGLSKNCVFKFWWVDRGKIKESYLLFYQSREAEPSHKKRKT